MSHNPFVATVSTDEGEPTREVGPGSLELATALARGLVGHDPHGGVVGWQPQQPHPSLNEVIGPATGLLPPVPAQLFKVGSHAVGPEDACKGLSRLFALFRGHTQTVLSARFTSEGGTMSDVHEVEAQHRDALRAWLETKELCDHAELKPASDYCLAAAKKVAEVLTSPGLLQQVTQAQTRHRMPTNSNDARRKGGG